MANVPASAPISLETTATRSECGAPLRSTGTATTLVPTEKKAMAPPFWSARSSRTLGGAAARGGSATSAARTRARRHMRRLYHATADEVRHHRHRLRRHVMPHRKLVVLGLDAVVLEHAAGAARGHDRDHVVECAVDDEHALLSARVEVGQLLLVQAAAHGHDAGERREGAKAGIERHQRALREAGEDDLAVLGRVAA